MKKITKFIGKPIIILLLLIINYACGNSNTMTERTEQEVSHKHYSIKSTQDWISHVANATDVSVINDGFLSMDKELVIDVAIELTKKIGGYAFWPDEGLWAVSNDMRKECLAQTYIAYGLTIYEALFSKQQIDHFNNEVGSDAGFSIVGASKMLGKENYNTIVNDYSNYVLNMLSK